MTTFGNSDLQMLIYVLLVSLMCHFIAIIIFSVPECPKFKDTYPLLTLDVGYLNSKLG